MTQHTSLLTELLADKNNKLDENFADTRRSVSSTQVYQTENIMSSPPSAFTITTSEDKPQTIIHQTVFHNNVRYVKVAAYHPHIAGCWYLSRNTDQATAHKFLITNKQLAAIMNMLKPGCITEDALYSRGNTQGCTFKMQAPVSLTSQHIRPQTVWPSTQAAMMVSKMCGGADLNSLLVDDAPPVKVMTPDQETSAMLADKNTFIGEARPTLPNLRHRPDADTPLSPSDLEAEAILQQKQAFSGTPRHTKRARAKATSAAAAGAPQPRSQTAVLFNDLVNKVLEIADHVVGIEQAYEDLQVAHTLTKGELQTAESTINHIATAASSVHDKKMQIATARAESSDVPFTGAVSLKHCLATGSFYTSDRLYKNGFFSCEDMFQVFANLWVDETGTLVNKDHFQRVVRNVFQQTSSTADRPRLRASAVRDKEATLCPVVCPKKTNPVDGNDDPMDLDNPAYVSNNTPCVRLQPRYTAKAVEHLKKVWNTYLPNSTQDV